jgi:hypothetical protein
MFEMVNKAVQELFTHDFLKLRWLQIHQMAGVEADILVSTKPYPDEITCRLVAASQVLGFPSAPALELLNGLGVVSSAPGKPATKQSTKEKTHANAL